MEDYSDFKVDGTPCPLAFIQGGTMELGEGDNQHSVTLPSFHMAKYQVTQVLYEAITKTNPSRYKDKNHPVTNVNWDESKEFIKQLNKITEKEFRLPSESEWEYAGRGGVNSQRYIYCGSDDLKQVGWYNDNSGGEIKLVGLLLPNELGLYDMSGNVFEWCEDDYYSNFKDAPKDGSAWVDDSNRPTRILRTIGDFFKDKPKDESIKRADYRVLRGGYYFDNSADCRPTYRNFDRPDYRNNAIGFRLVFPLQS